MQKRKRESFIKLGIVLLAVLALNLLSGLLYFRLDLTKEKKYSVSKSTKQLLSKLDDVVYVEVYLDGDFPAGLKELQNATKDLLTEFRSRSNERLEFRFYDPLAEKTQEQKAEIIQQLVSKGLEPTRLQTNEDEAYSEKVIFPAAMVTYKTHSLPVQILENQLNYSPEEAINHSIISLEYKFASAISKLMMYKEPKIAFSMGHGEPDDMHMADIMSSLQRLKYDVVRTDLHETYPTPDKYKLLVIAKPTVAFSEQTKYKLDQYLMHGGRILWLVDNTIAEMDSLRTRDDFYAPERALNLNDLFFGYGLRINTDLIADVKMCNVITLTTGVNNGVPEMRNFLWYYFPLLQSSGLHAVVKNIDPVAAQFVNSIDTIRSAGIRKTILLHSSDHSKALLEPAHVSFEILQEKADLRRYNQKYLPAAVLLEGKFKSIFDGRLTKEFLAATDSVKGMQFKKQSDENRMIVISDGDIIINEVRNGQAYPLAYDMNMRKTYGNKAFLLNCIDYLIDDNNLIESRNKEVSLRPLDMTKVKEEKTKWQLLNVLGPLLLPLLFGIFYLQWRKRRYGKA